MKLFKHPPGVLALAAVMLLGVTLAPGAGRGEHGPVFPARVVLSGPERLEILQELDLDIDGVFTGWARVYLIEEELDELRRLGFSVLVLPDPAPAMAQLARERNEAGVEIGEPVYHTYDTLTTDLQAIAAAHPSITRLMSIGQSVQGRELWMMLIASNPDQQVDRPEFAYISSMHGDEVVGKEMCVDLIEYLTDNYGTDSRVTSLVDNTEIWIMPSMNPDGTELGQRYNANGYDLNRNFPDQFVDPVNTTAGRQPETAAVMVWRAAHSIDLSANMHGGALVANYPFDSNPAGTSTFSPTPAPDHDLFVSISRTYADNNPPMSTSNSSPSFDDGITNGADWYAISGGIQDHPYVWHGNFDVTLELSNIKWPTASTLPGFWTDNLESLLAYMERVHEGVRGMVTNATTGLPVFAEIRVDSNPFADYTDPDAGDYHRTLLPGAYTLEVSAVGYTTQSFPVTVAGGAAVRYDVALQPALTDLQYYGYRVDDGPAGDGHLAAGEVADLAVTLQNVGGGATGISGKLVPAGWFTELTRDDATYADLSAGASTESDAPHYGISVDPAVPAGHKLGFAVEWQAAGAAGLSAPFFLEVGACETSVAVDVPQPISDNQTTTSLLTASTTFPVSEIRVTVDITHTYIGDLRIVLTSPAGTPIVLHDRSGGPADDIVGTYGDDLTPAELLSLLAGESPTGPWKLDVSDLAGGDTGALNAWSLELCDRPAEATTPELRFAAISLDAGNVQLAWWPYPGMTSYRLYRSTDPMSASSFVQVADTADTSFSDGTADPILFWIITAVGPQGEGPKGHFGE